MRIASPIITLTLLTGCFAIPSPPVGGDTTGGTAQDAAAADVEDATDAAADATDAVAVANIACGAEHACALLADGRAVCWGPRYAAALRQSHGDPPVIGPTALDAEHRFTALAAGWEFSAGVTVDATARVWGRSTYGLTSNIAVVHRVVSELPVDRLAAAEKTLVLALPDALQTAGEPLDGAQWESTPPYVSSQGSAATTVPDAPVPARHVAAGRSFACASTDAGPPACWGDNTYGQLGAGDEEDHLAPTPIAVSGGVGALSAGVHHACVATGERLTLRCWGDNRDGQLAASPDEVPLARGPRAVDHAFAAPIADLALGEGHSCALLDDGGVWCWGDNTHGQLGQAGVAATWRPSRADVPLASALCAGRSFTCALERAGRVLCWGDDRAGQLGAGVSGASYHPTPRAVSLPPPEDAP